jgi:leader peptidase (prepilin peptidase)/N-methyltransferase
VEFTPLLYVPLAILGVIFGSFFNVAIHRWPLEDRTEREWIKTPSHCPKCKAPIKWYDNVPVYSWLALRGKCRACAQPISPRYILVEIGTALLWVLTAWIVINFGMTGVAPEKVTFVHLLFALVFASLYLLTFVIDATTKLIPDEIAITQFVAAWAFYFIARPDVITPSWQSSVICMLVLPAILFGMWWLRWMGDGDATFAAGYAALFGWPLTAVSTLLGFVFGGLIALPMLIKLVIERKYKMGEHEVAFGPFLALSAYICMFFGHPLVAWYFRLFGLKLLPNWGVAPLPGG